MKTFEFPKIEIVELEVEDIILFSNPLDDEDLGLWN